MVRRGHRWTPGGDGVARDGDQRARFERHRAVGRVARAQQRARRRGGGVVGREHDGAPAHLEVAQPRPVVVIAVDQQGGLAARLDVAYALERGIGHPLRLLVERDEEPLPVVGVADRHDGGMPRGIAGGQPRGALRLEEGDLRLGEGRARAHSLVSSAFARRHPLRTRPALVPRWAATRVSIPTVSKYAAAAGCAPTWMRATAATRDTATTRTL